MAGGTDATEVPAPGHLLTNILVNTKLPHMQVLEVIDSADTAAVALDPTRARILAALREPGSASTVAEHLGLTRQKANYHLRQLEAHDLVELVEERPRRGLTERIMRASAQAYALSPDVLGEPSPREEPADRLSSSYLLATASELIRDVSRLARDAARANKDLSTLTIEADVRFASAGDRAEFTRDLTNAVADLAARYHDETAPNGRWHRLVVAAHPRRSTTTPPLTTQKENTDV